MDKKARKTGETKANKKRRGKRNTDKERDELAGCQRNDEN